MRAIRYNDITRQTGQPATTAPVASVPQAPVPQAPVPQTPAPIDYSQYLPMGFDSGFMTSTGNLSNVANLPMPGPPPSFGQIAPEQPSGIPPSVGGEPGRRSVSRADATVAGSRRMRSRSDPRLSTTPPLNTFGPGGDFSDRDYYNQLWYFQKPGGEAGSVPTREVTPEEYYSPEAELLRQYQYKYNQAELANEGRYTEALGGARADQNKYNTIMQGYLNPTNKSSFTSQMSTVKDMFNQQEEDVRKNYKDLGAKTQQSLVNIGLGNTTAAQTMKAGNTRKMQEDLNRLSGTKAQMNLGVQQGQASKEAMYAQMYNQMLNQAKQNEFSTITNRTDAYPDTAMYNQLLFNSGNAIPPVTYERAQNKNVFENVWDSLFG